MSSSPFNKYVVMIGRVPSQLNEYKNTPKGGILLLASAPGTLFSSRKAANAAIERTLKFAGERGFTWVKTDYNIQRVQEDIVIVNKEEY